MTAVILAGGQNRRIGVNKAFLELGGAMLIEIMIQRLSRLFDEIIITTKEPHAYLHLGVRVVSDLRPESGSLVGLYTGLRCCGGEHAFIIACDMPLFSESLIAGMRSETAGHDVVVCAPRGNYEPLFAFYGRSCLPRIEELLEAGNLRILDFYPRVRVRILGDADIAKFDPGGLSFANINTKEDFRRIRVIWDRLSVPASKSQPAAGGGKTGP